MDEVASLKEELRVSEAAYRNAAKGREQAWRQLERIRGFFGGTPEEADITQVDSYVEEWLKQDLIIFNTASSIIDELNDKVRELTERLNKHLSSE